MEKPVCLKLLYYIYQLENEKVSQNTVLLYYEIKSESIIFKYLINSFRIK